MSEASASSLHANALVVGEAGLLIRGPSGSGKSALTLALLEAARGRGLYSALVADDRARLCATHGRIVARPVPGFEGLIERRGQGIVRVRSEPAAIIALIADLAPRELPLPRFPDRGEEPAELLAVRLRRLDLDLSWGLAACVQATLSKLGFDSP
jgi:hypothetical protein